MFMRGKWMAYLGKTNQRRLANVCKILNTTECQLASQLGLSRAALKSIERRDAPLYLQLALTALMDGLHPNPMFRKGAHHSETPADPAQFNLSSNQFRSART